MIRKQDRLYSLCECVEFMVTSSKTQNIQVKLVNAEEILDYKNWWPKFYKQSCLSDDSYGKNIDQRSKVKFTVSSFMSFNHSEMIPGKLECYSHIDGLMKHRFLLRHSSQTEPKLPAEMVCNYKVAINVKKLKDMRQLMQYIPKQHKAFYLELAEWPSMDTPEND